MDTIVVDEASVRAAARADIAYRSAQVPGSRMALLDAYVLLRAFEQNSSLTVDQFKELLNTQHMAANGALFSTKAEESILLVGELGAVVVDMISPEGLGAIMALGNIGLSAAKTVSGSDALDASGETTLGDLVRGDRQVWARMELTAAEHPEFNQLYKVIEDKYFIADPSLPLDQLVNEVPALKNIPAVSTVLSGQAPESLTNEDVKDLVRNGTKALVDTVAAELTKYKEVPAKLRLIESHFQSQQMAELKQREINEAQGKFRDWGATFSIASSLAYLSGNAQLSKTVGDMVRVGSAINQFVESVAVNRLDPSKVSSLVLGANVLSIGVALVETFGSQKSDPVMESLKALSAQIDALRDEMRQQFSYVNQKLDALLEATAQSYKILVNLQKDVSLIRIDLREQSYQLSRLSDRLVGMIAALAKRHDDLQDDICLGWKEKYPGIYMPGSRYIDCQQFYFVSATKWINDEIASPQSNEFSNSAAWDQLTSVNADLPSNLRYVARLAYQHFGVPLASQEYVSDVGNPTAWVAASRGYMQFASDWEELYTKKTNPLPDLAKMIQEGKIIAAVLTDLGGATASGRKKLYRALAENYLAVAAAAIGEMQEFLYKQAVRFCAPGTELISVESQIKAEETFIASSDPINGLAQAVPLVMPEGIKVTSELRKLCAALGKPLTIGYTSVARVGPYYNCGQFACKDVAMAFRVGIGSVVLTNIAMPPFQCPDGYLHAILPNKWQYTTGPKEQFVATVNAEFATKRFRRKVQREIARTVLTKAALVGFQKQLYAEIESNSILSGRLKEMDGAKKILESFFTLGLPHTFASSLPLQTLMGADVELAVPDSSTIAALLNLIVTGESKGDLYMMYSDEEPTLLPGFICKRWSFSPTSFGANGAYDPGPEDIGDTDRTHDPFPSPSGWSEMLSGMSSRFLQELEKATTPFVIKPEIDPQVQAVLLRLMMLQKQVKDLQS